MRYLDALLESLETTGPVKKSKPNNFKLLKTLMDRGKSADKTGDKLDDKYVRRHTKTGKGASDDKQQGRTLNKLSATGKEAEKSFTQADKLARKVHLKGGGKGDGKPRGKLRLAHMAYQQIGDIIAEAMKIPKKYPDPKTLLPVDNSPKGKALAASRLKTELELRDKVADQSKRTSHSAAALRKKGKKGDLAPPEQAVIMNNPELLKRLMK